MDKKARRNVKKSVTDLHSDIDLKSHQDQNLIHNVLGYNTESKDLGVLYENYDADKEIEEEKTEYIEDEGFEEEYSEAEGTCSTISLEQELFGSSQVTSSSDEDQPAALWTDSESIEEHDLHYLKDREQDDLNVIYEEKKEAKIQNKLFRCNTRIIRMVANETYLIILDARGFLYKLEKDGQESFKLAKSFKMDKYFVVDIMVINEKLILISNKTGILKEIDLNTFEIEDIRTNIKRFERGFYVQGNIFLVNKDIVLFLNEKYQKRTIYHFENVLDIKFLEGKFYFLNSCGFFIVQDENIFKVSKKEYFSLTNILIHHDRLYLGTECGLKIGKKVKKYGAVKTIDAINDHVIVVTEDALRVLSDDHTRTWKIKIGCVVFFQNRIVFSDGKFLGALRL
ncbi:hypothetical protein THOM_1904 [Trachipleistophora hominis]|uniref:Uncharacterized protein n=1 Tax=Trachipleistophora hominis TaxID=72359 RepID=L7JWS7_TRAHO|nr:hypothetical protein THOM_1904 [Trachipleistophora hominis]